MKDDIFSSVCGLPGHVWMFRTSPVSVSEVLIQKVQDPVQAAPTDPADPADPWDPTEPQKEKSPVAKGDKSLSRPWLVGYLGSIRAPYSSEGGSAEEI